MSGYDSNGASECDAEWVAEEKHITKIACAYAYSNRIEDFCKLEKALERYFGKDSKELKKYQKEFCSGGK